LIAERLNTGVLQIPKSMEAPGMRLVLLPEYEGYEKTWVSQLLKIAKISVTAYIFIRMHSN
jgi:hypothetical protein